MTTRQRGVRRPYVAVRLDPEQAEWIDTEAARRGLNRSEMMRLMLDYAAEKMPAR